MIYLYGHPLLPKMHYFHLDSLRYQAMSIVYMFLIGLWNFRFSPRHPPHMDTKISWAEAASPDELDEEFDFFPTLKGQDVVKMRYEYDRLRSVAGRIQMVVGDIANQGEMFQALLSWRDPRLAKQTASGSFRVSPYFNS
ncbi:hypothetical protein YC2023_124337 [Brassica napus]